MELRLQRKRIELGDFLKTKRQSVQPIDVGLQSTRRRRTKGLRREELASLAGVGLTWYTWAEQGRDIKVSSAFLHNIAKALKLDNEERHHLYVLAGLTPPATKQQSYCKLPAIIRHMLDDLHNGPAYVMNLNWDILGFNKAGQFVFKFEEYKETERNMLWMLFADERLSVRMEGWEKEAPLIVASFRRDYTKLAPSKTTDAMIAALELRSPLFKKLWNRHEAKGKCSGTRIVTIDKIGPVLFDHKSIQVDSNRHLSLVYYHARDDSMAQES